jgi:predicted type IV restriction endonuclease
VGAPQAVLDLVNRFREQYDSYRLPSYGETQLRREFVDPFFKALGWDIDNEQGNAEAYKDVVHEDSIKIGGATKAPDYSLRIGGVRKFFVEAKKPSVNIAQDVSPAFQLRRYGWSAKLPLSILTDFEEFAVYDCRIRPEKNDKASTARTLYLTYEQYDDRWDEIASIFSPDAIRKGSFDRYAETTKKKRGTAEVDDAFLKEIELWRSDLARNLATRNSELSQRELNVAVQKTIDRIIVLRICEDRGIEAYGGMQSLLNGAQAYARLCELFRQADDRYNSGLFHFTKEKDRSEDPDEWTLSLQIDDRVLKDIIRKLYYPESPYEFSVMPAEILGHVYEQFLGKVIRLTKGHQAKIEDKPEVKKAGGVYYTPTYIVDYIVEQTVGKLLEGKQPHEIAARTKTTWKPAKGGRPLAVLDPACGSGSFLIGAYQYLLDWYRDWYVQHDPAQHKDRIYQTRKDQWRLTTAERKRILLDHIYGVDIDTQAVEVTKLSLLLKVLEGENQETLQRQLRLFRQRALPDLADNIKCGNSLIGPDFYRGQQLDLFDDEQRLRINVFDWIAEFAEIMKSGGFDVVIGNPPYVRMEEFKDIKQYLRTRYACHDERTDLYVYFIEKEHALLKKGGAFGMIVSNKFIRANYGQPLRRFLEANTTIKTIVDLAGLPVFRGATVRTIVLISENDRGNGRRRVNYSPPPQAESLRAVEAGIQTLADVTAPLSYRVPLAELGEMAWRLIRPECSQLMDSIAVGRVSLRDFMGDRICMGIKSGLIEAFVISRKQRESIVSRNPEAGEIIRPFLQGRQVRRFAIHPTDDFLIYTHHGIDMTPYPAVIDHLHPFRKRLEGRATRQEWFELQQPQFAYANFFKEPKIIFPDMATGCRFALDEGGHFCANTIYFLPTGNRALLGVLNSRLAHFFFQQTCAALEGPAESYLRFFGQYLNGFPVSLPKDGTSSCDGFVSLVQQMLVLQRNRQDVKTDHERTALARQIEATDREIDRLVYELYGLSDEEIRIVEEATAR